MKPWHSAEKSDLILKFDLRNKQFHIQQWDRDWASPSRAHPTCSRSHCSRSNRSFLHFPSVSSNSSFSSSLSESLWNKSICEAKSRQQNKTVSYQFWKWRLVKNNKKNPQTNQTSKTIKPQNHLPHQFIAEILSWGPQSATSHTPTSPVFNLSPPLWTLDDGSPMFFHLNLLVLPGPSLCRSPSSRYLSWYRRSWRLSSSSMAFLPAQETGTS